MECRNITVRFGDKTVFENASFSFPEGKITALVGPSGCGKTTLLRLLCGLQKPDAGEVDRPKTVSVSFSEPRLFPWMTVKENILLGKGTDESLALRMLAAFGLAGTEDLYPTELSAGMQQRVSLVRALADGAKTVFLDEPFRGLDEETHEKVRDRLREFLRGRTCLLITHDPADLAVADRVIDLGQPIKA